MTTGGPVPPSLLSAGLRPVWAEVRSRLDRHGPDYRARIRVVVDDPQAERALRSLLDRNLGATVDLAVLEAGLARLAVGADLDRALTALGFPPSERARVRRETRARAGARRRRMERAIATWPESWAGRWADEVAASGALAGLTDAGIDALAAAVRRLIDAVDDRFASLDLAARDEAGRASRVEVAARVLGSAHGLDTNSPVERVGRRALAFHLAPAPGSDPTDPDPADPDPDPDPTEVWERAGMHLDRLSAPILSWGLDLADRSPLAELCRASTAAGLAHPITTAAVDRWPSTGGHRGPVLVAENPRVVEAAADAGLGLAVIATSGNPRNNVVRLIEALLAAGTEVGYHGDFDAAGLAICGRMVAIGCRPHAMSAADYGEACRAAVAAGMDLPIDPSPCGPTPWDPALRRAFNQDQQRRIVHEELVLGRLFDDLQRRRPGRTLD